MAVSSWFYMWKCCAVVYTPYTCSEMATLISWLSQRYSWTNKYARRMTTIESTYVSTYLHIYIHVRMCICISLVWLSAIVCLCPCAWHAGHVNARATCDCNSNCNYTYYKCLHAKRRAAAAIGSRLSWRLTQFEFEFTASAFVWVQLIYRGRVYNQVGKQTLGHVGAADRN